MAPSPTLVLVTGMPGTGKSTMAEVAAAELGAALIAALSRRGPLTG